jgi:hypothetical protein
MRERGVAVAVAVGGGAAVSANGIALAPMSSALEIAAINAMAATSLTQRRPIAT